MFSKRLLLMIPAHFVCGFEAPLTGFISQAFHFISVFEHFQVTPCSCLFLVCFSLLLLDLSLGLRAQGLLQLSSCSLRIAASCAVLWFS